MLSRLAVIGNLIGFMMEGNRKFWLMPLVIALFFVLVLIVLGAATPLAPFIYTMF